MSRDVVITRMMDEALALVEFDLRDYCLKRSDFEGLDAWLRTKTDGSVVVDYKFLDSGIICVFQNVAQKRSTTLSGVERRLVDVIRRKGTVDDLHL